MMDDVVQHANRIGGFTPETVKSNPYAGTVG